jgi:hypothetical protein
MRGGEAKAEGKGKALKSKGVPKIICKRAGFCSSPDLFSFFQNEYERRIR